MVEMKKLVTVLLLGLVLFSLIGFLSADPADDDFYVGFDSVSSNPPTASSPASSESPSGVEKYLIEKFGDWKDGKIDYGLIKILILILLTSLIYFALAYVDFGNVFLKFFISLIVGFLATYLMIPSDLIGILTTYSGLGLTLSIFVPFLILLFVTIVTVKKGRRTGIHIVKYLWIGLALFYLYKGLVIFLVRYGTKGTAYLRMVEANKLDATDVYSWAKPIITSISPDALLSAASTEILWGFIFIIFAILIIVMISRKSWARNLVRTMRDADLELFKDNVARSTARDRIQADATRDAGE